MLAFSIQRVCVNRSFIHSLLNVIIALPNVVAKQSGAWLDKGLVQLGKPGGMSAAFLPKEILFLRAMSDGYAAGSSEFTAGRDMAQHTTTSSWSTAAVRSNCRRRAEGTFYVIN